MPAVEAGSPAVKMTGKVFFVTGGTLGHDVPSYVERRADEELFDALLAAEFCYVLTSRQMGKSSLMVRTVQRLRESGVHVAALDLTAVGQNLTPEQWYDGLYMRVGQKLRLEEELDDFWSNHSRLSPVQRWFAALRDVVLARSKGPLVIFVDEIDIVRSLPFSTDEFFAAIRECYNRRTEDPEFGRLSFCLLGVATPSDLIQNTRVTPFNIGRRIELNDFSPEEAAPLARGLELAAGGIAEARLLLERVLFWTEGHPYLTQRLCQVVAEEHEGAVADTGVIDQWCEELFFSNRARERDDNLIFVRERLLRSDLGRAELLSFYEGILRGRQVPDDETNPLVSALRLTGVVRQQGGRLVVRNRIYERAFDRAWVQAHMPDAELRRQKAAFRRGMARAAAIAAVVVAAMTVMVLMVVKQGARTRAALAQSYLAQAQAYFSQAQATRRSGLAGQRLESLRALRAARPFFTNQAALRDEVLACLALPDLKETTESYSLEAAAVFDLNLDWNVSATGEENGAVTVRLLDGGTLKILPAPGLSVTRLRFSAAAPVLVAEYGGGAEAQTIVWNWRTGQRLFVLPHGIHGQAIDFSQDGQKLTLGQASGRVVVYSLPEGKVLNDFELRLKSGRPRVPQAIRFNPFGNRLAESSLDDLLVQLWELEPGRAPLSPLMSFYHPAEVSDISWHPRGELLATACADSCIYVWTTEHPGRVKKLAGHEGPVSAVAFNHRGTLIASLGLDETVRLWVPASEREMAGRLQGESFDRVQFSAGDDRLLATGLGKASVHVWDVPGGEYAALHVHVGPGDSWRSIDFSPDNQALAALDGQRALIWDADSGLESGTLSFTNAHAAWFSAESDHLVASIDEGLFIGGVTHPDAHNPASAEKSASICQLRHVTNELGTMAVTLDRAMAAIVHLDQVLFAPVTPGGSPVGRTITVGVHYHRIALHPTGLWMAAMIDGSSVLHLWNLSDKLGRQPIVLPGSEYFTFSPDGKWFVTCWNGRFDFYQIGAWQRPAFQIPRRTASELHAPAAFSQDGSMVALAISRYTIELLRLNEADPARPDVIATLEAPDRDPLEMLAFSPDGRRLAAATRDHTIQLWNLKLLRDGLAELDLQKNWPEFP